MKIEKKEQIILAIDREFASGGKAIAEILSRELDLPIYDHNIIELLKEEGAIQAKGFKEHDENPRSLLFTRTVRGMTNSNASGLAKMQFDFIKRQARSGQSFIVMGHCANEILKKHPGMVSIFISADKAFKKQRAIEVEHLPKKDVVKKIKRKNQARKQYHNSHCDTKWGDSRYYDLCLKSNFLGIEKTAQMILDFLELKGKIEE